MFPLTRAIHFGIRFFESGRPWPECGSRFPFGWFYRSPLGPLGDVQGSDEFVGKPVD